MDTKPDKAEDKKDVAKDVEDDDDAPELVVAVTKLMSLLLQHHFLFLVR